MTTIGGTLRSLPFPIDDVHTTLIVAGIVVLVELTVISWIRRRFLFVPLRMSCRHVAVGGVVIAALGLVLGSV